MRTIVRLAARNTLRRRARSLLTAGMVVVGVALLLIALTWLRGVFGSMLSSAASLNGHVRIVDRDFAAREELLPLEEHVEQVTQLVAVLRQRPGVVSLEPRITAGVTVTVGEEIGEVFALAVGASETYFRDRLDAKQKLAAGTWFTGSDDEIIAGATVVTQAGAKVGDEMVLVGTTQDGSLSSVKGKLVGVVKSGGFLDRQIFLPLAKLQYLADIEDGATELLVYGADYEQASSLADRLRAQVELHDYEIEPFAEREPWKSTSGTVRSMQAIIISVVVFLAALGIWNTMTMSVLERTHEIGVLRAMGLSRIGAVMLFLGEALAIGGAGGLLGIALGAYPAWLLESKGMHVGEQVASNAAFAISDTVHGDLSVEAVMIAFGLGLLMAVLGSVIPAIRAASIQPVSAMRSGR